MGAVSAVSRQTGHSNVSTSSSIRSSLPGPWGIGCSSRRTFPISIKGRPISSTWWGSWFAGALLSIGGRKTPEEAAGWPAPTISWTWDKRYPHSTVHQYCFCFTKNISKVGNWPAPTTISWTWDKRYPLSISIVDNSYKVFAKWRPSLARLSSSDLSPLRPPDMLSCTWRKYIFFDRAIDVKLHWAYHWIEYQANI